MNYKFELALDQSRAYAITLKRLLERQDGKVLANFYEIGSTIGTWNTTLNVYHDAEGHAHEASWLRLIQRKVGHMRDELWRHASGPSHWNHIEYCLEYCDEIIDVVEEAKTWKKDAYGIEEAS